MQDSPSRTLLEHWNDVRAGAPYALRKDIRPQRLGKALPLIFMIARHDGALHFRLAGTSICALFGRELKGAPFSEFWESESASLANASSLQAIEASIPLCLHITMNTPGSDVAASLLLLPVAATRPNPDRLIGALELKILAEQRILNEGLTGVRLIMVTRSLAPLCCKTASET